MPNFQRKGSSSNSQVGDDFERLVLKKLTRKYKELEKPVKLKIGIHTKKLHKYDIGSIKEKVIVECKSHTWTEGDRVPSAKLTTWDQAMFYFYLAPSNYKKIFVVKKDMSAKRKETLCKYYLKTHNHLIPKDVEFWELDEEHNKLKKIFP